MGLYHMPNVAVWLGMGVLATNNILRGWLKWVKIKNTLKAWTDHHIR